MSEVREITEDARSVQKRPRFWVCIIGPADQDDLPEMADSPMRNAAIDEFYKLTGHEDAVCYSGWGTDVDSADRTINAWMKD